MNRNTVAVTIVIVWLGAIGFLIQREYLRDETDVLIETTSNVPPGAVFYAVTLGETQVGYTSTTVDTIPEGVLVIDVQELYLPVEDSTVRINARTEIVLDQTLGPLSFETTMQGDDERYVASGTFADSAFAITLTTADTTYESRMRVNEPFVFPATLPLGVAFGGILEAGASRTFRVFDPITFEQSEVHVEIFEDSTFMVPDSAVFDSTSFRWSPVHYDTVHAWRATFAGPELEARGWVDELGRMVNLKTTSGYEIDRSVFEVVYENFRRDEGRLTMSSLRSGPVSLATPPLVSGGQPLIEDLTVRIEGLDRFQVTTPQQTARGDTLHITTAELPDYRTRFGIGREQAPYIRPNPLMQSNDPRIQALARQIAGGSRSRRRQAELLNAWVAEEIEFGTTGTIPNAVEVWQRGTGNVNDKAVLFVTLSRAMGIPARPVSGLRYSNGTFYHHAWAEVYLTRWIPFDPSLGQVPADAAHVRLLDGLARRLPLSRKFGAIKVAPLEAQN